MSGRLEAVEMEPFRPEEVREFIEQSVPEQFYDTWKQQQVDYCYRVDGVGRFRVNGFLQRIAERGGCATSRTIRRHLNSLAVTPDAGQTLHPPRWGSSSSAERRVRGRVRRFRR